MNRGELETAYLEAQKSAKQSWNTMVSKGEAGYLRALDGIIQSGEIASEVSLGLVEVPLHKVIGTYTHSRSISFANNFMPLMDIQTEFAGKWMSLYEAHIEEGIRDPIKVYEYLNRFYAIEGNKRVSVLKFVEATAINGNVIRLIPKRDPSSKINNIYYEFMQFYKHTKINTIWFSEEGRFLELLNYIQKYQPNKVLYWTKEKEFISSVYRPFRIIYLEEGGKKLDITTGDAFLSFLKIYGLPDEISGEHRVYIKKLMKELEVIDNEEANVNTDALEAPKKRSMLTSITDFITPKKVLKIAFVYAKTPANSGWAYAHELGRLHIDNVFKDQIQTEKIVNVPENENAYDVLEGLAKEKYDIVFTTSPTFVAPALKAALQYPEVKFFNCATTHSYKSLTLYFGRIHEPRYLLGMIAGAMTKTNIVGYVAPYPISEVISSVNAFTLGVRAVNPRAVVKTMWTYRWDNPEDGKDVAKKLAEMGADIISNEDLPVPQDAFKEYGVYSVGEDNQKVHYAMAIWNWGIFYEKVIKNIVSGTWKSVYEDTTQIPMNFWLGMNTGIVDILYSNRNINPEMKRLIESVKKSIISKEFFVFEGPIYDQNKRLKVKSGVVCEYDEIVKMDWLVDGVEGVLPQVKDFIPTDPFSYRNGRQQKEDHMG